MVRGLTLVLLCSALSACASKEPAGPSEEEPDSLPPSVTTWTGDGALQLGGLDIYNINILFGAAPATGDPAIFTVSGADLYRFGFQDRRWAKVSGVTLPGGVTDAAATSESEIWVATSSGLYKVTGTTTASTSVQDSLIEVDAAASGASRLVVALARSGTIWYGDGTNWQQQSIGAPASGGNGYHVCVPSMNNAFVTTADRIWRYDGTSWTSATEGSVTVLSCTPPDHAFGLTAGSSTLHWSGSGSGAFGQPMERVVAASPTEIYGSSLVGTFGHRTFSVADGSTWRSIGESFFGQSATAGWADPRGGAAYMALGFGRLNRLTSSGVQLLSYSPDIRDIILTSPTSGFAVGWNMFLARWNGQSWTVDQGPANTQVFRILSGVWSDGPDNAWAVASLATIFHWDGQQWSMISDATSPMISSRPAFRSVWGQGNTVFIASSSGIVKCSGTTTCALEVSSGTGQLWGVWGTSLNNVFAVGDGGRILQYSGTAWVQVYSPTTRTLSRVKGSSSSDVWAVGDSVLLHYDGTFWRDVPMTGALAEVRAAHTGPVQDSWGSGLWVGGPRDVYVGGDNGRIARFDGSDWTLMPTSSTGRIISITGVPGYGALALQVGGAGPKLLRGSGTTGGFASPMTSSSPWPP